MTARRRILEEKKKRQRSERRGPFPEAIPKEVKSSIGRSTTRETPLQVRMLGMKVNDTFREFVRERVGFKLGKFALEITRVGARFEKLSALNGAGSCECRITVVLRDSEPIVVSARSATPQAAFAAAAASTERAVKNELARTRVSTKGRRRAAG